MAKRTPDLELVVVDTQTKMKAGRAVAVLLDDELGRRLVLTTSVHWHPSTTTLLASNQREAKHAVGTLLQLLQELPP